MTPYPKALADFPRLRQSTLATFSDCALSSHFELTHTRHWSTHPQARGTIFHRFAAKALTLMQEQGEKRIPQDVALALLRECLRQHDVDTVCSRCGGDCSYDEEGTLSCDNGHVFSSSDLVSIPSKEISDLRWMVVKFASDNEWSTHNLAGVEQRLVAPVHYDNPDGGRPIERELTGQLDALFVEGYESDHAIVVDFKTSWALPPETSISNTGYFQQVFYAYLVLANLPAIQRVTLREFYVRQSAPREASVHRKDFEDIGEELAALAERFDRVYETGGKLWQPSPGTHCSYCTLPERCPIFPDARGEGSVTSWDDAKKVAAEIIVAEAVLKKRRSAARAWANAHGPIPIKHAKDPSRVLGFKSAKRTPRPSREDLERAIREGMQVDDLYRESSSTRFCQFSLDEEGQAQARADAEADADLKAALKESIRKQEEANQQDEEAA